jgi:hypothetical protein
MGIPSNGDIPSQYMFNPADDRQVTNAGYGETYRALASAEEELGGILEAYEATGFDLNAKALAAIRTARSAVRRAGFIIVLRHGSE